MKFLIASISLFVLLAAGCSNKEPVQELTSQPVVVVVNPAENGGQLMLASNCVLLSDGTAILKESQLSYQKAKELYKKKKITKAELESAYREAMPRPADEVIASVEEPSIPEGWSCDRWRYDAAHKLVVGAPKPKV